MSKAKQIIKNICKVLVFIAIFCAIFAVFMRIFGFKYSKSVTAFYDLPKDSVDVLVVGSSHAYHNVDPSVFYDESGITAFVMGSSSQMVWNSYFYIKEACKTQHPKVVFLECYKAYYESEYSDEPTALKAVCNMKFSRNFLEHLWVSLEDKSKYVDSALMFPWYHSRYSEINKSDYLPNYGDELYDNYLGYNPLKKAVPAEIPYEIKDDTTRTPLLPKTVEYLDKAVELSKEEGFELVLLLTPYCEEADWRQAYYNTLADYAAEHEIKIINGNCLYEELELDGRRDFGTGNHLNNRGVRKMSLYLNDFMKENYDLADHRGDPHYQRWEDNTKYMKENYPIKKTKKDTKKEKDKKDKKEETEKKE